MLAEVASADVLGPLSGAGVAGLTLWWFMNRAETRMREGERRMIAIENAANRTTRAILMLVLSINSNVATHGEAGKLIKEVDDAERDQPDGGR